MPVTQRSGRGGLAAIGACPRFGRIAMPEISGPMDRSRAAWLDPRRPRYVRSIVRLPDRVRIGAGRLRERQHDQWDGRSRRSRVSAVRTELASALTGASGTLVVAGSPCRSIRGPRATLSPSVATPAHNDAPSRTRSLRDARLSRRFAPPPLRFGPPGDRPRPFGSGACTGRLRRPMARSSSMHLGNFVVERVSTVGDLMMRGAFTFGLPQPLPASRSQRRS